MYCMERADTMSAEATNKVGSAMKGMWLLIAATVLLAQNAEEVKDYVSHSVDGNTILITCEGTHKVRVYVCRPDIARIEFDPAGEFYLKYPEDEVFTKFYEHRENADLASYVMDTDWPGVSVSESDKGDYVLFQTSELSIRVYKSPLRIHFYDAANSALINKDADDSGMKCFNGNENGGCRLYLGKKKSTTEHFFGFANGNRGFNNEFTCDYTGFYEGANPEGWYYDSSYTYGAPFFYSTDGYGIFVVYDEVGGGWSKSGREHVTRFDMGMSSPDRYTFYHHQKVHKGYKQYLIYYFIKGPSWGEVIDHYTDIVGKPVVYRKKYFGVSAVHRAPCPATVNEAAARKYRSDGYPLDMYIFEGCGGCTWWGYCDHDLPLMQGHSWFADEGHEYWSGSESKNAAELIDYFHERGFLVGANMGASYQNRQDEAAVEYIVDHGFDIYWRDRMFSGRTTHTHAKIPFESFLKAFDNDTSRAFIRQGWATWAAPRYGPHHVGDMNNLPMFVKAELAITLGGYPYGQIDIGVDEWWCVGHSLLPMPFYHLSGTGRTPQPWTHEGRENRQNNYRKWMRFHESMVPYLYSYACRSSIDGMPVWRHMMTADPKNPATWDKDYQAYVGEWLLHAPKNGNNFSGDDVSVWIPEGTWYDWFKGTKYTGERTITYNVAGYQLPLFAKQGAIIPVGPEMDYIGEIPEDPLTLKIWPHGNTEFELWEDATPVKTTFRCSHSASQTAVVIPGFPGSRWSPADRKYLLEVHAIDKPEVVRCNSTDLAECSSHPELQGKSAGWYFDDAYPEGKCYVKPGPGGASGCVVYLSYDGNIDPVATEHGDVTARTTGTYAIRTGRRSRGITVTGRGDHIIRVYTPHGRVARVFEGTGPRTYEMPLHHAPGAVYLLDIRIGAGTVVRKVIPGVPGSRVGR